jgi:hypothetical protein
MCGCDKWKPIGRDQSDGDLIRATGPEEVIAEKDMKAKATFKIQNLTKNRLELNPTVKTTCGCTSAVLRDSELAPGGSTDLVLTVGYNGSADQLVQAVVSILNEDANVTIPLKVHYPVLLYSKPRGFFVSPMKSDEETREISIFSSKNEMLSRLKVRDLPDGMKVKIAQPSPDRLTISLTVFGNGDKTLINEKIVVYDETDPQVSLDLPVQVTFDRPCRISDLSINDEGNQMRLTVVSRELATISLDGPSEMLDLVEEHDPNIADRVHRLIINAERRERLIDFCSRTRVLVTTKSGKRQILKIPIPDSATESGSDFPVKTDGLK